MQRLPQRHDRLVSWGAALAAALVVAAPADADEAAAPPNAAACLTCHGDPTAGRFVDPAQFSASVHGAFDCTSCHTDATEIPHQVPLQSLRWAQIPATCGQCHGEIQEQFARSVHGKAVMAGRRGAPVCTDCHGVHMITKVHAPESMVSPAHIPETCGRCHAAAPLITRFQLPRNVVSTYLESYHGLASQLGSVIAANCASCHGAHAILPSTDPESSIHPRNLPKTCGQCHAGVSARVTEGRVHAGATAAEGEHPVTGFVRRLYLWLFAVVLGGMFLHNLLDFLRKLREHKRRAAEQGMGARMSLNERIQHAVLLVVFLVLAYTGFALKFPHAWWVTPLIGHGDWRALWHRGAAALFVGLGVFHLWYILGTRAGRAHLRELLPCRIDLIQPFQMIGYNLGWRRERPVFGQYSYIEKAEYWALVWGSMVMAVTGFLLLEARWTLTVFPKWVTDVATAIHLYEAILACAAIVLWHFYFVLFDPDEYPMKWTWVSGRESAADARHRQRKNPREGA